MPCRNPVASLISFKKEKFQEALNEKFVLEAGNGQLELELVSIEDLTPVYVHTRGLERVPFSAQFRGPRSPWARQHTYRLQNATLGELEIFLVPLGPDQQGMIYEAVFS